MHARAERCGVGMRSTRGSGDERSGACSIFEGLQVFAKRARAAWIEKKTDPV